MCVFLLPFVQAAIQLLLQKITTVDLLSINFDRNDEDHCTHWSRVLPSPPTIQYTQYRENKKITLNSWLIEYVGWICEPGFSAAVFAVVFVLFYIELLLLDLIDTSSIRSIWVCPLCYMVFTFDSLHSSLEQLLFISIERTRPSPLSLIYLQSCNVTVWHCLYCVYAMYGCTQYYFCKRCHIAS